MQKRVLIVEDEGELQKVLCSILEIAGCEVDVASDGVLALEQIAQAGSPDLIFLDLAMPRMDGMSFVRELRKQKQYQNIPIVVMSGDARVREQVDEMQMDVFIEKPFSVDEVLAYVEALLDDSNKYD